MPRLAAMTLAALGVAIVSPPVAAQTFLGRLGGACTSLPANHQQMVPLGTAISAGSTLIVTVAASSNFVSGLEIDDVQGNRYQALGGVSQSATGALIHFRSPLQRGLAAGSVLMLSYENAGAAVDSCVSVLGYSGIPFGNIVQETLGTASGQSTSPQVSANAAGSATRKLVLGAFATAGNPGNVSAQSPASALPVLCAAGNAFCLVDAQYFDDVAGTASVAVTTENSIAWSAALATLQADGIFGNGFD